MRMLPDGIRTGGEMTVAERDKSISSSRLLLAGRGRHLPIGSIPLHSSAACCG